MFRYAVFFIFLFVQPIQASSLLEEADAVANDPLAVPTPALIDAVKRAISDNDDETYEISVDQLFERITGFPSSSSAKPAYVSENEFMERMCAFFRIRDPLLTPQRLEDMRHHSALMADSAIGLKRTDDLLFRSMLECMYEDGRPTPTSVAMRDGMAWSWKLSTATFDEAQSMERDYAALMAAHPDNMNYKFLHLTIALRLDEIRLDALTVQNRKLFDEGPLFRVDLIEKAHGGDLRAQLEVARRLETGNRFRQHNAMAYFWYTRALNNGGGEVAQAGLDRLHSLLTPGDFFSIDIWTRNNHRPY
ncbi:MAG: hypothetical protein HQL36_01275 [Alphaproteobacteria bacterium]|nr:hypothetical protein [Alphaproteobacteria bacterium]MBF0252173.1 hypothetical protein [Alphaproteobacteria bacterium]